MFSRDISKRLLAALIDTPVVFLQGARQTGKSTLVQLITAESHPADYLTMDNLSVLSAAQSDPVSFLTGLRGKNAILDEIQRAPELYINIKVEVDRHRTPGRFLLTGSANALVLPQLSNLLAGRMELITLWPLAQSEISGSASNFIETAFNANFAIRSLPCDRQDVVRRALIGGYPEVVNRALAGAEQERRDAWFDGYVTTLLQRDVRDIANIQGISDLPLLLRLIASRATATLNISDLSRSARIPVTTLNRYLTLLQATFLIQLVQPWSSNLSSRLVKSPKLLLTDTGVLAYLNGLSETQLSTSPTFVGALVENFVGMELIKLISWSHLRPEIYYYRTHDRKEVDFVLRSRSGQLVGIEVKASATAEAADFRGLQSLANDAGDAFTCGIVLYTGDTVLPFGPRLFAVPISALWNEV